MWSLIWEREYGNKDDNLGKKWRRIFPLWLLKLQAAHFQMSPEGVWKRPQNGSTKS